MLIHFDSSVSAVTVNPCHGKHHAVHINETKALVHNNDGSAVKNAVKMADIHSLATKEDRVKSPGSHWFVIWQCGFG